MTKIVIAGAGTGAAANAGDEAIFAAMLRDLRASLPDADITLVSANPQGTMDRYPVSEVRFDDIPSIVRAAESADLMILGGGGLFFDYWAFPEREILTPQHGGLSFYTGIALLAHLTGTPLMIYGAGVGPLTTEAGKRFTRVAFEIADAATLRDRESCDLLHDIGVASGRLRVTADPAIALAFGGERRRRAHRPLIGVSLRPWSVGVDEEKWERELASGLDAILDETGGTVRFFPLHKPVDVSTDDARVSNAVLEKMRRRDAAAVASYSPTPEDLAQELAQCDLLIGMRLHSVLLAASAGVPSIAIAYDPKVASGLTALGGSDYVIPLTKMTSDLLRQKTSDLLTHSADVRVALVERARTLRLQAKENVSIAVATLEAGSAPRELSSEASSLAQLAADNLAKQGIKVARKRRGSRRVPKPGEKPRVAYLTNQLLDWKTREPRFGGGERYCLTLGTLLRDLGFDVTFFQGAHEQFEGEYFGFPVRTIPLGERFSEFHPGVCDRFYELAQDFDHVIINLPSYASGRVREDAIAICHGIWFDHDNWPLPIAFRTGAWFEHLHRAFAQPRKTISVDTNSINVIRAIWPDLASRMTYIPNWVDTSQFHPPAKRANDVPVVLFPRRSEVNRGSRLVAPILELIDRPCRFVWVGEGEESDAQMLRELAARDKRFTFETASFEEMPKWYQQADIAVIPTLAAEGTSLACLEALASGCATIATAVGGLPELIQPDVNGLLVDPSARAISRAITRLLDDVELRSRLQNGGPEFARKFSVDVWRSRWKQLLGDIGWTQDASAATFEPASTKSNSFAVAGAIAGAETSGIFTDAAMSDDASLVRIGSRLAKQELELKALREAIAPLDRALSSQSEGIRYLRDEVASRDRSIAEQEKGLDFLRAEVVNRDATIVESNQQISALQMQVSQLANRAAEFERAEADAREQLHATEVELELRSAQASHLEKQSIEQRNGIDWLRGEVAEREEKLNAIYNSRMWKTAEIYWRARKKIAPVTRPVATSKRAALAVGRKVLPRSVKRYLKRFWDPNQRISPKEAAIMAEQARSAMATSPDRSAAIPLPTKYDIVCFSIIDWSFRWQRPQQVMAKFAERGHRVFFFKTTDFLVGNEKRYEVTKLRDNVWEITLGVPRPIDVYGGELPSELCGAVIDDLRTLRREFNINAAVSYVQVATWAPAAFSARDAFGWPVVYDCMDEWNTFPGMKEALLAQERKLVEDSNLLVVTGQKLWEKWSSHNRNTVLARNATDFDHFHNPPPNDLLEGEKRPIVGYYGAIADWFDLELMTRLAKERPQYTFVLLGGVFKVPISELESLPNVRVLGQKPYALMPAYLQHFDVCIIPFKVNAITEATDPVKFYEYISQGKPVVAPKMPELYPYSEYLYIAESHDDFLRKVDLAVAEDDQTIRQRRIELAKSNTWDERLDRIEKGIAAGVKKASIVILTYNNLEYNKLCLDSVYRNTLWPSFEVIIVDNASSDGTPEYLREFAKEHDNCRIILNAKNYGFAKGNNVGLDVATGDYLILLNNDTVVPNGWLAKLIRHLDEPEIGLVNSVTNFSGNESKIEVPYSDLDAMEEFAAKYTFEHEGRMFDIRVAAMYCVAMRRDVLEKVGKLDDQFSIGMFEDDDYSHRMRLAGYRVVCVEDAFVHHFGQASFKKLTQTEYQAVWDRNQRLFETKWGVKWEPHTTRG